ncbi:GMC family oxidoreductase [Aspergillus saccharolyticus JOP 1030-1]|uniref:Putative GMC oxidoreductase n=1 Tax=Aspergillus saccharolyticus JOP 1030-1 TaxID=1450539 RepID=A0A318ZRR4_9EURO|nr:putative GMC oxidoreductase [Aspergillus saccharolyticus JOP 1030-1]PYH47053.1 putative GMC oxidoreductase [Aspergillus saccharolyticus JOP 1030-1]
MLLSVAAFAPLLLSLANPVAADCGEDGVYDYVVVGGGTAGNVMGARLSQAGHSVLIVEAGGIYELENANLTIPSMFGALTGGSPDTIDPRVDWGVITTPQAGANNRELHYARGKCLGGSSAMNAMIYQRGTKSTYHAWAEAAQDPSYEWDEILPFFKRTFHFTPPSTVKGLQNTSIHWNASAFASESPVEGSIQISYSNERTSFATWAKLGLEASGIDETNDFVSGSLMGTQWSASEISPIDERRSSSDFLLGVSDERSLTVCTRSLARRILFDEQRNAQGVEVETDGKLWTASAAKEVIVSAGAFNSPQLLMVSGIGPRGHLADLDIPLLVDLPGVGQNMWDHIFFGPSYPVAVDTLTKLFIDPPYLTAQSLRYQSSHDGPLAYAPNLLGWENLPSAYQDNFSAATQEELSRFPADWPQVEYIAFDAHVGNYSNPAEDQPRDGRQFASIIGALVAPTSRGNVTLVSNSTADLPVVNPNWLTTQTDIEVALALFKRTRDIWASDPLQNITTGPEYYPGTNVTTDEQILDVIRSSLITVWHASCTCKMGAREDAMAVVDSEARVHGVQRLRVVDASAFPILPPGHPTSTVYMLAEKIGNTIIGDKKYNSWGLDAV